MEADLELGHPAEALRRAEAVLMELKRNRFQPIGKIRTLQQRAETALEAPPAPAPAPRNEWINERGELGLVRVVPSGPVAEPEFMYDLFLASPMDAFPRDEDYQADQQTVSEAVQRLRGVEGLERIFYAGETLPNKKRFNDPPRALEGNVKVLRQSRSFVMLYPAPLPSSVLVEAGFALAWRIPGILFVRRNVALPYLLRSVTEVFPEMLVREFEDLDDVVRAITEVLPGHLQRHPRHPLPLPLAP